MVADNLNPDMRNLSEKQFNLMRLKSEIFDLQTHCAQARIHLEEKIKELNQLMKDKDDL